MRKILRNGHGNMKISKIAYPLGLFVCLFIYVAYVKWRWAFATQRIFSITETTAMGTKNQQYYEKLVTADRPVFYGIMFDAGSTGTRIHVFQFTQTAKETPILTHETFKALKPGLSAYADDVDKSTQGIQELLDVAKEEIPFDMWKVTPLVLKATAGLRLLPGEKAQKLLQKVREVFQASPFLVGDDCVSIMNGTDEGVSAWITVNFLTGNLNTPGKNSVGMLDLGGGSTQITFLPKIEVTLQTSPAEYITSFQMFNSTYKLYSYSYLGLGLMSARLAILGGTEGKPDKELVSPCFPSTFHGEWEHAEITYKISGHKTDKEKGGNLTVEDFEIAAKYVCRTMEVNPQENAFICMDLTYISLLLQEFGFPKTKVLKLARKIDDIETSWALGATFHYIDSLSRQQNKVS
ncbi:ectonucleoside triphosphate diphosphohydrolase 6 isoform X5 [Notamacropus eugenii]|uniref:ectonucleoside triphosphate diphosphohydrolase 6 isoform X5 n=1 Tax=Notamacropus eugenii TaxID=9315 RepID=UPI003B66E274